MRKQVRDSRVSRNAQQLPRISVRHPYLSYLKTPKARVLWSEELVMRYGTLGGGYAALTHLMRKLAQY